MSIFEQQPKRKVHNYDEEEIEEYFSKYDEEEPRELTDDEAETIFDSLHTFKKLAQAGYIELEPETLKMLDKL